MKKGNMTVLLNNNIKKTKEKRKKLKRVLVDILLKKRWLGNFVFQVKEVKNRRERFCFDRIWKMVWEEMGYEIEDFEIYEPFSVDLLVKLFGIFPIGTLRLIWESSYSLPIFKAFKVEKIPNREQERVEATLLAVKNKEIFGFPSLLVLIRKGYQILDRKKIKGVFVIIDLRVYRLLRRLGICIKPLSNEQYYKGSMVVPGYLDFENSIKKLKKTNPLLLSFFFRKGLSGFRKGSHLLILIN